MAGLTARWSKRWRRPECAAPPRGARAGHPGAARASGPRGAGDLGVVVVQSNRAGAAGRLLRRYLDEAGMAAADNLNAKARILLMLALTGSQDIGEIRRMFATY